MKKKGIKRDDYIPAIERNRKWDRKLSVGYTHHGERRSTCVTPSKHTMLAHPQSPRLRDGKSAISSSNAKLS